MRTAVFYGASDDLVEVSGVPGADEFTASPDDVTRFNLGGQMQVVAVYDGCWAFGVGQVDESVPLPDWPIRLSQSTAADYSVQLEVDCPDGTVLFLTNGKRR